MHASDGHVLSSNGSDPSAAAAQLDLGFAERRAGVLTSTGLPINEQDVALPTSIVKRDGRTVPFDPMRIERALSRCFAALGRQPFTPIPELAVRVVNIMSARRGQPTVEIVQDAVELTLQAAGEFEAAKAYILYRAEHAKQRQERPIPDEVRAAFAQADQYFPTALQKFQFFDKYARFDYDKGRRETWIETVDRAVDFLHELVQTNSGVDLGGETYARIRRGILEMQSMPSMRLLAMAGAPARRDSTAIYNCSYQPVESIDSFCEALLISMAGCGVGYSVESRYVDNFPRVQRQRGLAPLKHVVEDSAQGWAAALRIGMQAWFEGGDVDFDYQSIRESGTPLRTKGGRASGPGPLKAMLEFTRGRLLARQGAHIRPIDAHDMMCMVGNAAVSGGVRRCLPAGTRVHTHRGAIPIEEVRQGDLAMTADGYKPVTGWVDQGIQGIVEIVTESGTIFRCTPHHRVAVLTDVWGGHTFKYAADLTPEDRLLFITRPIDGETKHLRPLPPKRATDHSGSVVHQPALDIETAWFLGKFLADGYAQVGLHDAAGKRGNTQFSISCSLQETEQVDRVTRWMEQHGLKVQRLLGQGGWLTLRSSNRQIARWAQHYKQPRTPLQVPEEMWRAPRAIRAAFVAGLMDGDGCFSDRPVTVVATVYESFGREVVKLLATLGIIAEIRVRRPETDAGWRAQWSVTVKDSLALQTAQAVIGAHACTAWVPRHGKQAGYSVPGWMVRRDVARGDWASLWPASRDAAMNSATLTSLVQATHYVPVAVREVRASGQAHTYDIEVRDGSMFVAEGYLVHNTAMISLFDFDDLEMRLCKNGDFERENSQRWNANNSAVWPERGLDQMQVVEQVLDMVKSQRGEPGIFNRKATLDLIPERRKQYGYKDFGTNPCGEIVLRNWEFCVSGDTLLITKDGVTTIRDAVGKPIEIWNGKKWAQVTPFKAGENQQLYRVWFRDGSYLDCTGGHRFSVSKIDTRFKGKGFEEKTTLELMRTVHRRWATEPFKMVHDAGHLVPPDDAYELGFAVGDGCVMTVGGTPRVIADLYGPKDTNLPLRGRRYAAYLPAGYTTPRVRLRFRDTLSPERVTALKSDPIALHELFSWSREAILSFIAGWIDADGSETVTGGVRLYLSGYERARRVQLLLTKCGIRSSVNLLHQAGTMTNLGPRRNDLWYLQITECSDIPCHRVNTQGGHLARFKGKYQVIAAIEPLAGTHDSFCFTEPEEHKGVFGNSLTYQCNLSIAVARREDTLESMKEKVEMATLIGTIQSLATHFPDLRPIWKQNCVEERLLGVDITGQMDSPIVQDASIMQALRAHAVETNRLLAEKLGINQSAAVTCVKPSGNSSQLLNCSSGLHARWAPYYERNVRVAATSPIFKVLRDAAVPMDPENGQNREDANTWVVHFPVKSPDGATTRKDRSAIEQCNYWLHNKLNWTEHNPSVTITYRPDEIVDLIRWIWEHHDLIGGMAFLPTFDAQYAQLPYIEISKEEYERRAGEFPQIDFSKLWRYESSDLTTAAQELACVAGGCDDGVAPG